MRDLEESIMFATMMTLADEKKDKKERNVQKTRKDLYWKFNEEVVYAAVKPHKQKAASIIERIMIDADRTLGCVTELRGYTIIDMAIESVLFKCIDRIYYDTGRKLKAFEYACRCCDTLYYFKEAGAWLIFEKYADSCDIYNQSLYNSLAMIIKGASCANRSDDLSPLATEIFDILCIAESALNAADKSVGWSGSTMKDFFFENVMRIVHEELEALRSAMQESDNTESSVN